MAAMAIASHPSQSSLKPQITVRASSTHPADGSGGNLIIQLHISKLYVNDRWQDFTSDIFPDDLSVPLSILTHNNHPTVNFLRRFYGRLYSAQVPEYLWGDVTDELLAYVFMWRLPNSMEKKQQLRMAVRIEIPVNEPGFHELRHFRVCDEAKSGAVFSDDCSICFDGFRSGGDLTQLTKTTRCGHLFHSWCLAEWLQGKDSCPLCRRVIIS